MSMNYLLDTHTLSNSVMSMGRKRNDLFVLREVANEYAFTSAEMQKITSAGISIIDITKKHLAKLTEVMSAHGANTKLIGLFSGKGTADVVMLAYVLSERDNPDTLFKKEYTLVTKDKELTTIAKTYGIDVATSF